MSNLRRFFSGTVVISLVGLAAVGCVADQGEVGEPIDGEVDSTLGPEEEAQASGAAAKLVIPAGAVELIEGRYIVQLKDAAVKVSGSQKSLGRVERDALARDLVVRRGLSDAAVVHVYDSALNGFVASMTEEEALQLAEDPDVELIEQDQVMVANVTWGLDRIDERDLPMDGNYNPTYGNGSGAHAYVIDTGIRTTHNEFTGRVGNGYDSVNNDSDPSDCNGHGTHVAGTVGGTTYGVAPGVILHGVRVLNCSGSGSNAGVIAGIDWVTQNHVKPAVANMSLGGGASSALDNAVSNSINAGVTYVVAAGNSGVDACGSSPARVSAAITVGATSSSDARASWSNFGSCLDIFAPGVSITSAWKNNDSSTSTISGTSMASPHVAGAAARYLSSNPGASPSQVTSALINASTSGKVTSAGSGSPNRLLYVGN
ncbi:MAG TPA: S8 family peptidase [Candidatus Nanopelagicales bacterium]|nr:S8 family peptidase [Candidatus Nanopelagicales bacterium]